VIFFKVVVLSIDVHHPLASIDEIKSREGAADVFCSPVGEDRVVAIGQSELKRFVI
jgi:hypothetical protein